MTVNLRYFAAMVEAAGMTEESVSLPAGATVGDLRATLITAREAGFAKQLAVNTLLIDGAHTDDAALLPSDTVRADVLPPFAGG